MLKPSSSTYPEHLSAEQKQKLDEYARLLFDVNKQFNLVSRGDIAHVISHHIVHCLALAQKSVSRGTHVVDWGSGGGLPAIPLAIVWPEVQIVAVDSNGKKTKSIDLFCRRLGIANCVSNHVRAEEATGAFQYSVSRATAPLVDLWSWHNRVFEAGSPEEEGADQTWREGLICLKGGDLTQEIKDLATKYPHVQVKVLPLSGWNQDPFYDSKYTVEVFASASTPI
ncbi:16S rRNA (guanine(527)-N(7))-methyltransferase RsmG [bacterium]|nr:16S rRNA (guanine(527)-N(7))-methyltransferase RsmG [bacterium]